MGSLGASVSLGVGLFESPTAAREYLVESDVGPADASPAVLGYVIYSTASFATASLPSDFVVGTLPPYVLRLATSDFTTAADDPIRPNELWDGRLINPGEITRSAPLTPGGDARIETASGQIVASNGDGAFDTILDTNALVSQEVSIRIGVEGRAWSSFVTVARMRVSGVGLTLDELTLDVEDPSAILAIPYPTSTYAGTGGVEGDVDLADTQRQVVFGRCLNVPCRLINRANLIYQIHDGPMMEIGRVLDRGVNLSNSGGLVSTYSSLVASAPAVGAYTRCLPLGMVKLGDEPAGILTADVRGHAPAGDTLPSISGFLANAATSALGFTRDSSAFSALPVYTAGWLWNEPFTYGEALSRFVGDGGFVWGSTMAGVLSCAKLEEPSDADADLALRLEEYDMIEIERLALPAGYESTHSRRVARYGRIWQVFAATDVAGVVNGTTDAALRQIEWRQVVATSTTAVTSAFDPGVLETSLAIGVHATKMANALISLHGRRRLFFRIKTKMFEALPAIFSNVLVTHPRFGLSGGQAFRVVSITLSLQDGTITYYLWG